MAEFDYDFNKIIVLKSLGDSDTFADELYYNTIVPRSDKVGLEKDKIDLYDKRDWEDAIAQICCDEYNHPLLHFEMHGDAKKGIKLRLGDYISWPEFIDAMRKVNVRSGMNLIITMATCFSIQTAFNIKMYKQAAPYLFSLTSKNEEIMPEITYAMYKIFFEELIATRNLYRALKRVECERPDLLRHFVFLTVPTLFENVWKGMPKLYNSGNDVIQQFFRSFPEFQATVIQKDITKEEFEGYKDGFVRECNSDTFNAIYSKCRDIFFLYDEDPENRRRFKLPDSIM